MTQLPLPVELALAGLANCCGAAATNPLDVSKVRLQLLAAATNSNVLVSSASLVGIYANEGVRGLYSGLAPSLLREMSYSAMRLGLYGPIKAELRSLTATTNAGASGGAEPIWLKLVSGAISGCIGCAIASPSDLIKVRLQAVREAGSVAPTTIIATARSVYLQSGVVGLYQGVGVNVQRAALLTAAQVGTYDIVKSHLRSSVLFAPEPLVAVAVAASPLSALEPLVSSSSSSSAPAGAWRLSLESPLLHLLSACAAGLATAVVTTPVDTAKSIIMNQRHSGGNVFKGSVDCLAHVAATRGLRGVYAGFAPTWARVTLHSAVTFSVYEQLRAAAGMRPV